MPACARHFFLVALTFALHYAALPLAFASLSETEPNNQLSEANLIQCGDTVLCASVPLGDVDYYRFLAASGDSLYCCTLPCGDSNTDTYIVLFGDDLEMITSDNDAGPLKYSMLGIYVEQTAYYRLRVVRGDQVQDADSLYSLVVSSRVPVTEDFDFCETARVVTELPYYNEGDTYGKHNNIGNPSPDVFYRFHQPVQSDVFIQVCTEYFNARVQIIEYCMGGYLDDAEEGCYANGQLNGATLVSYSLPAGDYYVVVEGVSQMEFGEYSIEIAPFFPDCSDPQSLVLFRVGGQPALDWPDVPNASYYIIQQSPLPGGPFEYLDVSPISFYIDPVGFAAAQRFYRVFTVCPWSR